MILKIQNIRVDRLYDRFGITFYVDSKADLSGLDGLKGEDYIKIEKVAEKRTMSQIGYIWMLLGRLAEDYRMPVDDIYREFVRRFYKYEINVFPSEIAEKYMSVWNQLGTGWQSEVLTETETEKEIICYVGMSKWNRKELSQFIDMVKEECRERGVPTER